MDELDRHFERQMRSQERQLVAVRLTIAALAAVVLVAFRDSLPSAPVLLTLIGVVVGYTLVLWVLSAWFPAREVGIVATALDMAAVTVAVYVQPGAVDAYLFYGLVVLGGALRFGLAASIWSSIVCSGLYATVVLLSDAAGPVRSLLPVRLVYLVGIGLAAGLYARLVLGRAAEVARLRTRLDEEERERTRAREEALLSQLAHDFSANLDREATVSTIVRSTGNLMGDLAELWLVDAAGERLELADVTGRDQHLCERARQQAAARTPRMGEGVIGRAAATATTVLVGPDPSPAPDAGDPDGIISLGLRSLLAVPIVGRGRVRGVLVAASAGAAPIGSGERRLAEAIAERAGPALENAALWADLQEQMAREQEAQRVKDDFLSIVSHELRTPLTSISGYAQLLERRLRDRPDGSKEVEQLRIIREQSGRMRRLVEDLLDVSRIDRRGGVGVEPVAFDLVEELQAVVARTRRAHGEREILLEAPETLPIEADRDRIGQVLTNLADNAAKYSPDGGAIRVVARADGNEVEVRVIDQGVGIPDDLRDRVFDLFVQADGDASRRRFGGLGLGLYITRAIVDAHGGRVWAEANRDAGAGTIVVVRLPIRARQRRIGPEPPPPGEPPPFVLRRPGG
ncbi:MAG: ATP-binding protein [Chloroflexota bacterium]|nr:ATP-binding protein [Chloroflexota bacterium]